MIYTMAVIPEMLKIDSPDKLDATQKVGQYFITKGYKITDIDVLRPWGFYFYFDPAQTEKFAKDFFDGVELTDINTSMPLQPKVLVFEPGKVNSWQYHHRRSEIWRVISPKIQTTMSDQDDQPPARTLKFGDVVNFPQGMRHRGGAVNDEWGAVAEIWQHTDPNNPSDEADIVRLQDDFGRANG